jgi:hypothetical protein
MNVKSLCAECFSNLQAVFRINDRYNTFGFIVCSQAIFLRRPLLVDNLPHICFPVRDAQVSLSVEKENPQRILTHDGAELGRIEQIEETTRANRFKSKTIQNAQKLFESKDKKIFKVIMLTKKIH